MTKLKGLPWNRSGWCDLDSCYHVGTEGPADCSGMLIDDKASIYELKLDVYDNGDPDEVDTILEHINNFPESLELLKTIKKDAEMALSGEWDCTTKEGMETGFKAQIYLINKFLKEIDG